MQTPCTQCSRPTNRPDGLCPNCFYAAPGAGDQTEYERVVIETFKFFCSCGESRTGALILMEKGPTDDHPGLPPNRGPRGRDHRCGLVPHNPEHWFGRCHNCQQAIYRRSPGRPRKYKTAEDREFYYKNRTKIYLANLNTKVLQSYGAKGAWPGCVMCNQPATRVLYVGEFGKAPIGNQYWHCRKLAITDAHWHLQFAPYCDSHEVMNLGQRYHERKRRDNEHLMETLAKQSQILAERL